MSLTKNQQMAAVALGVWGVVVAGAGYFYWSALSARQQAQQDFSDADASIDEFYSRPVFPEEKAVKSVKANESAYTNWLATARAFAAGGDRTYAPVEGSVFKQELDNRIDGVLSRLPGGNAEGKLAAAAFNWSFDTERQPGARVPDLADTPPLRARLDIVTDLAKLMSESGVVEVKALSYLPPPVVKEEPKRRGNRKKEAEPEFDKMDFSVVFLARPAAIVRVLDALTGEYRFFTVTSLNMRSSEPDAFAKRLAGPEENAQEAAGRGRGRGRRRALVVEEQPQEDDSKKVHVVTDPETDPPVEVTLKFSVYDFRTGIMGADPRPRKFAPVEQEEEAPFEAEAEETPGDPAEGESAEEAADTADGAEASQEGES